MPLPIHHRESLLSAALDGKLSDQEQLEFDQFAADDPSLLSELNDLRQLRDDLRANLAGLRAQRLASGSVERIVEAAFSQSPNRQGSHKVSLPVEVAPASSVLPHRQRIGAGRRWAAAALALAASLFVMVSLNKQHGSPRVLKSNVATLDGAQLNAPDLIAKNIPLDSGVPSDASAASALSGTAVAAADQTLSPQQLASDSPVPDASRPKVMGISSTNSEIASGGTRGVEDMVTQDMLAVDANTKTLESNPSGSPADAMVKDRAPLGHVIVLSVELTQVGRERLALQEALRTSDIRLGKDNVVSPHVLASLQNEMIIDGSADSNGSTERLFLIEASAKRIDRLMTYLMSNSESFDSIGFTILSEPPLLAAVGELREIDPTKVRNDSPSGLARNLVITEGRSLPLARDLDFIPLSQDLVSSGMMGIETPEAVGNQTPSTSALDDFPSQLLLQVK